MLAVSLVVVALAIVFVVSFVVIGNSGIPEPGTWSVPSRIGPGHDVAAGAPSVACPSIGFCDAVFGNGDVVLNTGSQNAGTGYFGCLDPNTDRRKRISGV